MICESANRMKSLIIYDDSIKVKESIRDVIGQKHFGDVILKKRMLSEIYRDIVKDVKLPNVQWVQIQSVYDLEHLVERETKISAKEDIKVIHCFANFMVADRGEVCRTYEKLKFLDESTVVVSKGKIAAIMFTTWKLYHKYVVESINSRSTIDIVKKLRIPEIYSDGLTYIGDIFSFIRYITGNFDTRYFNSFEGDSYILTKRSHNKEKIHAEYNYYQLLPEDMRFWFVPPFHYEEKEDIASYQMERLHMTDLAFKYVHGSMDMDEFQELLDKYFYFLSSRHQKNCDCDQYSRTLQALYEHKVEKRIKLLKQMPEFKRIRYMTEGTTCDIDYLYQKYRRLKDRIEKQDICRAYVQVIGHGDLCFANTLYSKTSQTFKLIDPKGALTEDELWTDPYYDVAKLSHSICGRYDFFNYGLYDIVVANDFEYKLEISFDNRRYIDAFREKAISNGFHFVQIRIYEVSLFLSMLPLHIDNPHKVLAFILNARDLLKEIECMRFD